MGLGRVKDLEDDAMLLEELAVAQFAAARFFAAIEPAG
jgi:hypothetical protein